MKQFFDWDEELGLAVCTLQVEGGKKFIGTAQCAVEDQDMKSMHTGMEIASMRASLNALIDERDNIWLPGLKALKEVFYCINRSGEYDKSHYEAKMLYRKIQEYEANLKYVRNAIKSLKANLTRYIDNKENYYIKLRKLRAGQNQLNNQ